MEHTRLNALKSLLKKDRCTHILVSDTVDAEYISGFRSSNAMLLVSARNNILFTDFRYQEAATRFCASNDQWRFVLAAEGNFAGLPDYLGKGALLGIQSNAMTLDQFDRLSSVCSSVEFVKLPNQVTDLSIAKLPAEIASIRKAAHIGDQAFAAVLDRLKPGVTELEIARALESLCSDFGSEKPAFDTIVLFGPRSALPHGTPGTALLKKGDLVLFDFGCKVDGFCSDMTRTVVAGRASGRQQEVYGVVLAAQETARKAARSGMKASELDSCARKIIESEGYGAQFGHALGHGVGLRIHEPPRVGSKVQADLPENAVVTIEPGIYIPGFGGVRIEDMTVLHKKSSTILTRSRRDLIEVDLW